MAPQAFSQTIEQNDYVLARMAVCRRMGILRFRLPAALLAAAMIAGAVATLWRGYAQAGYWLTAAGMAAGAAALLLAWFFVFPHREKTEAQKDFQIYARLYGTSTVSFTPEGLTLTAQNLTRRVDFARLKACIEQKDTMVLVAEDGLIILRKNEETATFLRRVCSGVLTKG